MSQRTQRSRLPIETRFCPDVLPRSTILSTLQAVQPVAHDVSHVTVDLHRLRSGYAPGSKTADEGVLLSWPNLSTLHLIGCLLPDHDIAASGTSALENVREFYYAAPSVEAGAAKLFRMLRLMRNLQDLRLHDVLGDLDGGVLPPIFHLRSYHYHSSYTPTHWHLPLLNSYVSLKVLSLRFDQPPPVASVQLVADIIGPSLESLALDWDALLPEVAGILIPACSRLQILKLGSPSLHIGGVPDDDSVRLCRTVLSDLRTPLRYLSIGFPGMLGLLVAHVARNGIPPSLRSLRRMHLSDSATRRVDAQVQSLARACARRRIRLSLGFRAVLE